MEQHIILLYNYQWSHGDNACLDKSVYDEMSAICACNFI